MKTSPSISPASRATAKFVLVEQQQIAAANRNGKRDSTAAVDGETIKSFVAAEQDNKRPVSEPPFEAATAKSSKKKDKKEKEKLEKESKKKNKEEPNKANGVSKTSSGAKIINKGEFTF